MLRYVINQGTLQSRYRFTFYTLQPQPLQTCDHWNLINVKRIMIKIFCTSDW